MHHKILLKQDGQITATLSDNEAEALVIHHKAGLTIALDHEEMVALASVLATLPGLAVPEQEHNHG